METRNSKNKGSTVIIIILTILVIALSGYIGYEKILSNTNISKNETNTKNESNTKDEIENVEEKVENKVKGECPLTKFDNTYTLTDADKEEIMESIESLNAGFTKQTIDINTFTITMVSESGYYFNMSFDSIPNGNGAFASITKVNNKFKVLTIGSGDTIDGVKRMEYTLNQICR